MKHFREEVNKIKGAAWKHGEKFHMKKHEHLIKKLEHESREHHDY